MTSILIKNGCVWQPDAADKPWKTADLLIQGEQIKAIEPAATVIDRIKHEYACCIDAELDDCWVKRHLDRQSENKLRRSAM